MSVYNVNIEVPNATLQNHYDLQQAMKLAGFIRSDEITGVNHDSPNGQYYIAIFSDLDTVSYIAKFVATSALASDVFDLVVTPSSLYI
jgi:hypothetical protein